MSRPTSAELDKMLANQAFYLSWWADVKNFLTVNSTAIIEVRVTAESSM